MSMTERVIDAVLDDMLDSIASGEWIRTRDDLEQLLLSPPPSTWSRNDLIQYLRDAGYDGLPHR